MSHRRRARAVGFVVAALLTTTLRATPAAPGDPPPTALRMEVRPSTVPPGSGVRLIFHWDARPTNGDCSVFVHIRNERGGMVLQADHQPPFPMTTSNWSGPIEYSRGLRLPANLPPGKYRVSVGLYDKKGPKDLVAGPGVHADGRAFEVGQFVVDPHAPAPPLDSDRKPTLDLAGYHLTFHDEFDGPLDVSASGPGTRWTAHTPYGGDFGNERFANPGPDSPFSITDGVLQIEARKVDGHWRSGLLCSVDPKGAGFAQQYGYFEMRAQFPKGPGTWPAFWLNSLESLKNRASMGFEIDVVEQYGNWPGTFHGGIIWWYPNKTHAASGDEFFVADTTAGFHTYGFLWDEREMRWYFDGVEVWRQPTPPEAKTPMYVLVNLALGGGWPITGTSNPSTMKVDYVRVYSKN